MSEFYNPSKDTSGFEHLYKSDEELREISIPHTSPNLHLYRETQHVSVNLYRFRNHEEGGDKKYILLVDRLYDFLCNHQLFHRFNRTMIKDDSMNITYPWDGLRNETIGDLYLRNHSSYYRKRHEIISDNELCPVKKCELEIECMWCDYIDETFQHYINYLQVNGWKEVMKEKTFKLIRHLNMEKQLKMIRLEDVV